MEYKWSDRVRLYIGSQCITRDNKKGRFASFSSDFSDGSFITITVRYSDKADDWDIFNDNEDCDSIKLLLRPFSDITGEEWMDIWGVIGGTPHLFGHGIDVLKECLEKGDWDESGMQMDYYTISQLINYLRRIDIDCDDLIPSGRAIDKTKPA